MRILHVYRTYFPDTQGGLEEVIRQICLNTQPYGLRSRVLTLTRDEHRTYVRLPEADVYRARLTAEAASCGMSTEAFALYREQAQWADLIHYHFPWPFGDLLHLTSRIRRPSVVTYHSDIVRQRMLAQLYAPVMRRFLDSVDRIVCTSPNYFATSDVLSHFRDKVSVIPIGLNKGPSHRPSPELLRVTQERFGTDFFLFVGVLRYYKGLHILLKAMRGSPCRVIIAGAGPIEQELKAQAKALQLDNVVFAGHVSDAVKGALYELCRAVVFPSYLRSEAFGVTLLEGAIHARPLISTEIGSGTSYVNLHQKTGFVVPPSSPMRLREAMDALHADPGLAARMGKAARDRYDRLFTGPLMGTRYTHIYEKLVQGKLVDDLLPAVAER